MSKYEIHNSCTVASTTPWFSGVRFLTAVMDPTMDSTFADVDESRLHKDKARYSDIDFSTSV